MAGPGAETEAAAAERRREEVSARFFEWIEEARGIVEVNFDELGPEDQAHMTISLATSMMLTHKLGEIENELRGIRHELNTKEQG